MSLETVALRWLAWEKKCLAVVHGRTPRYQIGVPDVLGLTRSRYLIEVEIKRSVSDFKKNASKYHISWRDAWIHQSPRQVYFFVPDDIAAKVEPITPEWAGLAKLKSDFNFDIIKQSPVNAQSKRLTVKECVKMFHLLSNQLVSQTKWLETYRNRFQQTNDPYYWCYEI